jgi:hypothetical protein
VIDERRHVGGVGDEVGFAGDQRFKLAGEVTIKFAGLVH